MSLNDGLKYIADKLSIDVGMAKTIYKKYWDFVEIQIINDGTIDVDGIGEFFIDKVEEKKKTKFNLNFNVSKRLENKVL